MNRQKNAVNIGTLDSTIENEHEHKGRKKNPFYVVTFLTPVLKWVFFTFIPLMPKSAKNPNSRKIQNFILENIEKQMVPCKSTAKEVSFEWSHHMISSTDSKVRTTRRVSIIDYEHTWNNA